MKDTQTGQALVESLLAFVVVASFVIGILWLGQLQDLKLQLGHMSRRAAFAAVQQNMAEDRYTSSANIYLQHPGNFWSTRLGHALNKQSEAIKRQVAALDPSAKPGGPLKNAAWLRRELRLGDDAISVFAISSSLAGASEFNNELNSFDRLAITLNQATAILNGSGAGDADKEIQQRIATSQHLWASFANYSKTHGSNVATAMQAVDAAWGRPQPGWDWLSAWSGSVPKKYLKDKQAP